MMPFAAGSSAGLQQLDPDVMKEARRDAQKQQMVYSTIELIRLFYVADRTPQEACDAAIEATKAIYGAFVPEPAE